MLLFSSFLEWKEIQPCQKFSDSLEILSHFKARGSLHTAQVIISHSFEFAILKEQFVKKKKKDYLVILYHYLLMESRMKFRSPQTFLDVLPNSRGSRRLVLKHHKQPKEKTHTAHLEYFKSVEALRLNL